MAFAIVSWGDKKVIVMKKLLMNRQNDAADCFILGKKHRILIDGCNDNYELLNEFVTIHNTDSFKIEMERSNIFSNVSSTKYLLEETPRRYPKCKRILEIIGEHRQTLKPRNIFAEIIESSEFSVDQEVCEGIEQIADGPSHMIQFGTETNVIEGSSHEISASNTISVETSNFVHASPASKPRNISAEIIKSSEFSEYQEVFEGIEQIADGPSHMIQFGTETNVIEGSSHEISASNTISVETSNFVHASPASKPRNISAEIIKSSEFSEYQEVFEGIEQIADGPSHMIQFDTEANVIEGSSHEISASNTISVETSNFVRASPAVQAIGGDNCVSAECLDQAYDEIVPTFVPDINNSPIFNRPPHMNSASTCRVYISPPPLQPIGSVSSVDKLNEDDVPIKPRRINKANLCKYCNKRNTNIKRHITTAHRDEDDVKNFLLMTDDNPKKNQLLSQIRRDDNFIAFGNEVYIPSRQKQQFIPEDYVACSACQIILKKDSLRKHYRMFCPNSSAGPSNSRSILKSSRAVSEKLHSVANDTMRNLIFPAFRDGPVKEIIRFDELIILYGNEMCLKYRAQHHFAMIRNRMIRLAKILLLVKPLNNDIVYLKDMLKPKHYETIIRVINDFGHYNSLTGNYEKPTLPTEIGSSLKYVINLFISECIKQGNITERKNAKNLLHLLTTALPAHVNKTATESLLQKKRLKTPLLPIIEDIQKLNTYLLRGRVMHHEALKEKFSLSSWLNLGRFTLITILIFNRRRPGEMERARITDLGSIQKITQDDDIYGKLSDEERRYVDIYLRFVIRGKLARGVPVLLHTEVYDSIKLLLQYRAQAGVLPDNPYIFGTPQHISGQDTVFRHHLATKLIRQFSEECGAEKPSTLRATLLRKQVATFSMSMNLNSDELQNFQNYMGHADKIHREYYRQPVIEKDIIEVSGLLLRALGHTSSSNEPPTTPISSTATATDITSGSAPFNSNINENDRDSVFSNNSTTSGIQSGSTILQAMSENSSDPDYVATSGTSSEEDDESPTGKRIRLFGMDGGMANIKRRWSASEKEVVRQLFSSYLEQKKIPTHLEISQAVCNCPDLKSRTIPQIQMWISNNIKQVKGAPKKTWNTPAKTIIRKTFDRFITSSSKKNPTTMAILKTIGENPELLDKTPRRVRSQIQNQRKIFSRTYCN